MIGTTLTTMRRLPVALRLKLQTTYAEAWEALTETHQTQAIMFVRRMADRLTLEDALARYFHEVAVPVAMRETVRARALLALAERINPEPAPSARAEGWWDWIRPDHLLQALRRRAQYVEETTLHCRMAACIAEAAVMATHVRMATQVGELLTDVLPPDEAVMVYVRSFELPVKEGDAVFRSPRLQVAPVAPEPEFAPEPAQPIPAARVMAPAFGLRVIV
jgi:hypothetical protein